MVCVVNRGGTHPERAAVHFFFFGFAVIFKEFFFFPKSFSEGLLFFSNGGDISIYGIYTMMTTQFSSINVLQQINMPSAHGDISVYEYEEFYFNREYCLLYARHL